MKQFYLTYWHFKGKVRYLWFVRKYPSPFISISFGLDTAHPSWVILSFKNSGFWNHSPSLGSVIDCFLEPVVDLGKGPRSHRTPLNLGKKIRNQRRRKSQQGKQNNLPPLYSYIYLNSKNMICMNKICIAFAAVPVVYNLAVIFYRGIR